MHQGECAADFHFHYDVHLACFHEREFAINEFNEFNRRFVHEIARDILRESAKHTFRGNVIFLPGNGCPVEFGLNDVLSCHINSIY